MQPSWRQHTWPCLCTARSCSQSVSQCLAAGPAQHRQTAGVHRIDFGGARTRPDAGTKGGCSDVLSVSQLRSIFEHRPPARFDATNQQTPTHASAGPQLWVVVKSVMPRVGGRSRLSGGSM
ncbi:hypothetical protein K461DRAFT_100270 [Myriangium duriaei CBS 260.36]|uniref:Uncharacterized protein n=1 Tax=Myriangium duriaei CBS 260.36 TaxID=1168546 RepID=A0A9P4J7P2_9PEZI|nr:hypothetical protein K461DRAFT_100270 [Myriangium duriaei CBS 260.36]